MAGIIGIIAFLMVLGLSLVVTRIATIALTMTGLSEQAAKFQARSAFTGTGFTTSEAEKVVNHPVRRRIITLLMVIRSAGFITIIMSLILSLQTTPGGPASRLFRLFWIIAGIFVIWLLSKNKWFTRRLETVIRRVLAEKTDLDTRDYAGLLHLAGGYQVTELQVREGDWIAGKKLQDCNLRNEGITVLGILRSDGTYLGAPLGRTEIRPDDILTLYGLETDLAALDRRRADYAGQREHEKALKKQRELLKQQEKEDIRSRIRKKIEDKTRQQSQPPEKAPTNR